MRTVIITSSGMRGRVENELTPENVLKFTQSYANWMGKGTKIVLGRDTRNSSLILSNIVSAGLTSMGVTVFDAKIMPTPLILHHIRYKKYSGGVIITGSHNPEEFNGIKFVDQSNTFLGNREIEEIKKFYEGEKPIIPVAWDHFGEIHATDPYPSYRKRLEKFIDRKAIAQKNLTVVVDPNAGAASKVITDLLSSFNCKTKIINNKFRDFPHFPRRIEPISENLDDLKKETQSENANVGFAFDCDADRVTIVDSNGMVYAEDMTVLLPLYYTLTENAALSSPKDVKIVTNIASSQAFEDISEQFGGETIRTSVGEQYLAKKMTDLQNHYPDSLVIGGEGSSGGYMYPKFNNARDGVFASCKICEFLSKSHDSLAELVKLIPKYHSLRKSLPVTNATESVQALRFRLQEIKMDFTMIGNDIRIVNKKKKEWILVHPSNTEPVIRIIAESKEKNRSVELVKIMRNLMLQ